MANESTSPTVGLPPWVVEARYRSVESDTWLDNPLIEALPPVLKDEEFASKVRERPSYDAGVRDLEKHKRLMHVQRVMQLFVPMEPHVLLQQRFARIIRDGYVARNPIEDIGWSTLPRKLDDLSERMQYDIAPHEPPSALGFTIIGIGGVGKTMGVNAVLRTYPRVILHRSYTDSRGVSRRLMRMQIVSVKLDCPEDGTLKSLCLSFFRTVDGLTRCTSYYKDYGFRGTSPRIATDMLPDMARVADLHSIGLLIIDEIQFLSKQKSGGREQMLQFFTRLVNEIKLPVVLIGTPRAEEVLNGAFWQMRRNAGQGEFNWLPMEQGRDWERFLRSVWRYQYVRSPSELTEDGKVPKRLADALYHESQGIVDFAVKIFMIAQERAINSNFERLTPGLIGTVARDSFGRARQIIQGMRTNRRSALTKVDDVSLFRARNDEVPKDEAAPEPRAYVSETRPATSTATSSENADSLDPVLPTLAQDDPTHAQTSAETLRAAGYVRSATEFGL